MRIACTIIAAWFLLVAGAGCDTSGPEQGQTFAQQLRQVTVDVPSFAGIDFEKGAQVDQLVVYTFAPEQRGAAREALGDIFGSETASIAVRVRDTQGGASVGLVDRAAGVMALDGVIGISYGQNGYLYVDVSEAQDVERAKAKLKEIGISSSQVVLRATTVPVAY